MPLSLASFFTAGSGSCAGERLGTRESRCTLTRKSDNEAIRSSSSLVALEAAKINQNASFRTVTVKFNQEFTVHNTLSLRIS